MDDEDLTRFFMSSSELVERLHSGSCPVRNLWNACIQRTEEMIYSEIMRKLIFGAKNAFSSRREKPPESSPIQVAAGENHCLALDQKGAVWAWGKNGSGLSAARWRGSLALLNIRLSAREVGYVIIHEESLSFAIFWLSRKVLWPTYG